MFDVIPDIHGQADKLDALLDRLGWARSTAGWRAPDPGRTLVFLGDLIDRGPDNRRVIDRVRDLVDGGHAKALMGNHELNAILFHTIGHDGAPLRARSAAHTRQHQAFLDEFPTGAPETQEAVRWMGALPVAFEVPGFRAAHACWHGPSLETIRRHADDHRLRENALQAPDWRGSDLADAFDLVTKGPELALPPGAAFDDGAGERRDKIRMKWWTADARTLRDAAMSVPDLGQIPEDPVPADALSFLYAEPTPAFFGHYWLPPDRPHLQAEFAICLDYSAGKTGPLVAYRVDEPGEPLALNKIVGHPLI